MDSSEPIPAPRSECITEEQLEVLIAKYTLEYLYRWTNQFDPIALSGFRQLLSTADRPEEVLRTLRHAGSALPN